MELINESLFPAAWMVGKLQPPQWSMTCLVKGTFQLKPEEVAMLAEEQADLTGDTHVDKDLNKLLRYPSDFAYFKPYADLLLVGTGYVPNVGTSAAVPVRLGIGAYEKALMIVGDRMMDDRGNLTQPKPFQKMPLTYEHAYGGNGFPKNPLGKGSSPFAVNDGLSIYSLQNVEYPENLRGTRTRLEPAGFGPIAQTWPQRVTKMGTFYDQWL